MARPPRVEADGCTYHVISNGSAGAVIYRDARDFRTFETMLERVVARFEWTCLAYCLMTTHYHLLITIRCGGLSRGMQQLNGGFARYVNRRYCRTAHVFRNRFFSGLVEGDEHLLETCRYIVLNPVRAGICERAEDWRWSSYRACAGRCPAPQFLALDELLALLGRRPEEAMAAYRTFVEAGLAAS
jgi:REP element-mobilizing transposase RayT